MADVHLLQWTAAFVGALWLTSRWVLSSPGQRWRHIVAAISSTILWIPVAYTAGNVHVATDAGGTVAFGAESLGYFAIFMVIVNIAGLLVGLVLWIEGAVDEAHDDMPREMQHRRRG